MGFPRSIRALNFLLVALTTGLLLAGCSREASIGSNLKASQVEKVASARLTDTTGVDVAVTCDKNVEAKAGEVAYCTGIADGTEGLEQDVRITVKSIEGSDAKFNVEILKKWPPSDIVTTVKNTLVRQGIVGARVTGCTTAQTIEKGRSFTCGLTGVDGTHKVRITFKDDDGAVFIEPAK